MNNLPKNLELIILAIVLAVLVFLGFTRIDQYLKLKALDDCAKEYRYEVVTPEGGKVSYPLGNEYQKCLKEKGYRTDD